MENLMSHVAQFGKDGYPQLSEVPTLKHLFVMGRNSTTMIDLVSGVHKTSAYDSVSDDRKYSLPATGVAADTAVTGGNWVDFSTDNFVIAAVMTVTGALWQLTIGTTSGQGIFLVPAAFTKIVGASGTSNTATNPGTSWDYIAASRNATGGLDLITDGTIIDTDATDAGAIAPADTIGINGIAAFYGLAIFQFSGDTPSDYLSVLDDLAADLRAGNIRVPKACADWV